MKFFPHSFRDFLFQVPNKRAAEFDDFDWDIGGIQTNNAQRVDERPAFAGVIFNGDSKIVRLTLNDPKMDRDDLVIALNVGGSVQSELYALDEFGRQWYTMAKFVTLNVEGNDTITAQYALIFDVNDPTWTMVTETSTTWNIIADEQIETITVPGNQPANPVFELTAGEQPDDFYLYVEYIKNYNPIALKQVDGIDITFGGWDTAALVLAEKMLSTGNDVRVIFDGKEYPFWVGGGGWNNAATKIFIRATWLPGRSMNLLTALDGSTTPTFIEWEVTDATKLALAELPKKGIIRVENEEISYANLNVALCRATIIEREIRGTSIASHISGTVCWWVEHDIRIIYGNSTAIAPSYAATYKPVFNLTSSTNASRVYTEFADAQALRAGSWIRQELNDGLGKLSRVYSGNNGAIIDVDPATDMGMEIASYAVQGKQKPETADMAWMLYHPAEITTVTTTADKYKAFSTTTWPDFSGLESSKDGTKKWVEEWNESIPSTAGTPTSITHTSAESIASGRKYVRFRHGGSINAKALNVTRLEVHGVTVVLNSSNIIQGGMSGENLNFQLSIEIRNNRTSESLYINYPLVEGATLYIDSDGMVVTYKGVNAIRALSWDSIRTDWLHFEAGANEIQFFCTPAQAFQLVTRLHAKAL